MTYIKLSEYAKLKDIPYRTAYEWFNNGKLNGKKDENGNILIESSNMGVDQSIISVAYFNNHVSNNFVLKNLADITISPPNEKMIKYQYHIEYTTQIDQILEQTTTYLKSSLTRAVFDCICSLKNMAKVEINNISEVQLNNTNIVLCNPSFVKATKISQQFKKIEENNIYCIYACPDRYYIVMKHKNITYEEPFCIVMPVLNSICIDMDLPRQTVDKDERVIELIISHYKHTHWNFLIPENLTPIMYIYNDPKKETSTVIKDCMDFLLLQEYIDLKIKQQDNKYLITNMNNETLTTRLDNNEFILENFHNTVIKDKDTLIRIIKEWCKYTGVELDFMLANCKNLIQVKDGLEFIPHEYKPQITIRLNTQNKKTKDFIVKYDQVNDNYLLIRDTQIKVLRFAHTLGGLESICDIINQSIFDTELDVNIKSFIKDHPEFTYLEDKHCPYQTYIITSASKDGSSYLYIRVSTTDKLFTYGLFSHIVYNDKIYNEKNEVLTFETSITKHLETLNNDYKQFLENPKDILEEETDEDNKEDTMTTSIIKHITSIAQKASKQSTRLSQNPRLPDPIPIEGPDDKIHLCPNHDEETKKAMIEITKECDLLFQEIRNIKEVADLAWLMYSQIVVSQPPLVAISFFNSVTELMAKLMEILSDRTIVHSHDIDPPDDLHDLHENNIERALSEGFSREEIYAVPDVTNMQLPLEERQKLARKYHRKQMEE